MKTTPKYILIANKLKHEILTGEYNVNDQLPNEFELAKAYNVSRITIRGALTELEKQGLIYKIQGAGSFVKKQVLTEDTGSNQLELINFEKYQTKLLNFEVGNVSKKISQALSINNYDIVYTIKRKIIEGKETVAFQKICIPAKVIQGFNIEMMQSSIYPIIEKRIGIKPQKAIRDISLVKADPELLQDIGVRKEVKNDEPLLKWLQHTYLADQRPFEWNETYYRISRFSIKEAIVI